MKDEKKFSNSVESPEAEEDLMLVNVWENVNGEIKLTGQKPVERSHFDEMQRKQNFSELTI